MNNFCDTTSNRISLHLQRIHLCDQVETLREKIISLELSNAEDEVESITGTGASDAESESEEITGQSSAASTPQEKNEEIICTSATEGAAPKISANTVLASKKKKRKRSKKSRH